MYMEKFKVTCNSCNGSDVLKITADRQVFYTEHTPIISARYRPDLKWGFECICGQDSRVSPEEKNSLKTIVRNASDSIIKEIANTLTPKNELKFEMEKI